MILGRCFETLRYNQAIESLSSSTSLSSSNSTTIKVIPYREAKITRLFKEYFYGYGHITLITTISTNPIYYYENVHALKYAAIAKEIQLRSSASSFDDHQQQKKKKKKSYNIDQLLHQLYHLKQSLIDKEYQLIQVEENTRNEVIGEMEQQINEMQDMFQHQFLQQKWLTESTIEKNFIISKRNVI